MISPEKEKEITNYIDLVKNGEEIETGAFAYIVDLLIENRLLRKERDELCSTLQMIYNDKYSRTSNFKDIEGTIGEYIESTCGHLINKPH